MLVAAQDQSARSEPQLVESESAEQASDAADIDSTLSRARIQFIDRPRPIDSPAAQELPVSWVPSVDAISEAEWSRREDAARDYAKLIEGLELDGGTWAAGLVEQLDSLGELQAQSGNHALAVETYDRAIHINRINSGLNTLEQTPFLEKMIDSYIALGDWESADLYNEYLFYIQQKAYGSQDPRLIPVLERMADWHLRAFQVGYGEPLGLRLSTAQIMLKAAASLVGAHFGASDQRYFNYLTKLASSAFLVTKNPELASTVISSSELQIAQDELIKQLESPNKEIILGRAAGEELLREILQRKVASQGNIDSIAEAITHLADWYVIYGRRGIAEDIYRDAWDLLHSEPGHDEQIEKLFGNVVQIPAFYTEPISFVRDGGSELAFDELNMGVADLSFDVTAAGEVRNVSFIDGLTEANETMLNRLRRAVRGSHFRPRIVDGEPVESTDNRFRYRYWF